ncbi:MAG: hypothetical protein LHV68_09750 [Elusimicrobia bacterium]|nr:hypothetical protein [Candidatus Liberimonas magnetica]
MEIKITEILVTIITGIIGLLIGVKLERNKRLLEMKKELYTAFLDINAEYVYHKEDNLLNEKYTKVCDKLCIYGAKEVLELISLIHEKNHENTEYQNTEKGKHEYAKLVNVMRKDVNTSGVETRTILNILEYFSTKSS